MRYIADDDIVETANHFRCIDQIIELANYPLSEAFIKQLHYILKSGTSDSRKTWFAVGEYKRFENEVGGSATAKPADVSGEMRNLLRRYNLSKQKTFISQKHLLQQAQIQSQVQLLYTQTKTLTNTTNMM